MAQPDIYFHYNEFIGPRCATRWPLNPQPKGNQGIFRITAVTFTGDAFEMLHSDRIVQISHCGFCGNALLVPVRVRSDHQHPPERRGFTLRGRQGEGARRLRVLCFNVIKRLIKSSSRVSIQFCLIIDGFGIDALAPLRRLCISS